MPDGLAALAALGVQVDVRQVTPFRGIRFIHEWTVASSGSQQRCRAFTACPRRFCCINGSWDRSRQACGVSLHALGPQDYGLVDPTDYRSEGRVVASPWLICADGQISKLEELAGFATVTPARYRFGFRRHYRIFSWSDSRAKCIGASAGQMYDDASGGGISM